MELSFLPQCPVPTQETTTLVAAVLENLFDTWDSLCPPVAPFAAQEFGISLSPLRR